MANVIQKIAVKKFGEETFETKDIGAKAENIIVSVDANSQVVPSEEGTSTKTLTEVLHDVSDLVDTDKLAPTSHASADNKYGAATNELYGHVKIGTGLVNDTTGATGVDFAENGVEVSGKAVAANDPRLSNARPNPAPVVFSDGTSTLEYDGTEQKAISYGTIGAAPKEHVDVLATADTAGHIKVGTGLESDNGTVSVDFEEVARKDDVHQNLSELNNDIGFITAAGAPRKATLNITADQWTAAEGDYAYQTTYSNPAISASSLVFCYEGTGVVKCIGQAEGAITLGAATAGNYEIILYIIC